MKILHQYDFHEKYCKKRCILQVLVFRTHSHCSVTCAPGVRQLAAQQTPQTQTEEGVHCEWEENVLHWQNAEYSILFLMTSFHFLENPKLSHVAEGKPGDAELAQYSFWHRTMSKLCTHFSLPGLDHSTCPRASVTFSSFRAAWSRLGSLTVLCGNHLFQATGAAEETPDWCWVWLKANLDKDQLCPAPFQEVLGAVLSCAPVLLLRLWLTTFHIVPSCTCSVLWSVSTTHSPCHRRWQPNCSMGENV